MQLEFRKATAADLPQIMEIIAFAIESRRLDGSQQWQDGYPNVQSIENDIMKGNGYILADPHQILFYSAIIFAPESAYEAIEGNWLSEGEYAVIHRMAVAKNGKGKGLAQKMLYNAEKLCREKGVFSLKIDTNFDNLAMLHLLEKLGYTYCGKVYFRGSARKAFEKQFN
ncbi:MAG: GNAT family N-acetyltransferase [Flavobacteriaceae bacterium]|nr:GNAT family N-acetyltransferase [Flavobacteriaceae bacterium]